MHTLLTHQIADLVVAERLAAADRHHRTGRRRRPGRLGRTRGRPAGRATAAPAPSGAGHPGTLAALGR